MPAPTSYRQLLTDAWTAFLRRARDAGGRRVVLDVLKDGALRFSHDGSAASEAGDDDLAAVRAACSEWSVGGRPLGSVIELRPDPRMVTGDLQSPEVLFALRELAAASQDVRLVVRLPAGTRW